MSQIQSDISLSSSSVNKKGGARLKTHMRSASHNKVLNKLPSSSSYGSANQMARPKLNRSKSTDGLIRPLRNNAPKRNNRSFTKLTALHPLTKSVSNQSSNSLKGVASTGQGAGHSHGLKTSARKGRAILQLNDEDVDNEQFEDLENEEDTGDAPEADNRVHDTQGADNKVVDNHEVRDSVIREKNRDELENNDPGVGSDREEDLKSPEKKDKENPEPNEANDSHLGQSFQSSSEDLSNNVYSGSLLLSQSTGLIRKIENHPDPSVSGQRVGANAYAMNDIVPGVRRGDGTLGKDYEKISGISFKADSMDNIAEPVTNTNPAIPNNSYQPNQTIFNNLQRTNSHYLSQKKHNQQKPPTRHINAQEAKNHSIALSNNFSNFLNKNPRSSAPQDAPNSETRTQQRLWLQRENSFMDVSNVDLGKLNNFSNLSLSNMMFAQNHSQSSSNLRDKIPQSHQPGASVVNANGDGSIPSPTGDSQEVIPNSPNNINGLLLMLQNNSQNSIQSRTEYERLNREYLNVRRHLNPVGESIDRLEKCHSANGNSKMTRVRKGNNSMQSSGNDKNNNTFKEFSPSFHKNETEIHNTINSVWQNALFSSSSAASSVLSTPGFGSSPGPPSAAQQVRPINPRLSSFNQQQKINSLRAPNTPTTRAVKLANTKSNTNVNNLHFKRHMDLDQSQFT